jgi:prepilin peptidase CpaA
MAMTMLLIALTLVAATTDLLWHKIYNANVYTGILLGLGLNAACSWRLGENSTPAWEGCVGLEESLKGFAAIAGLMLACFVLFDLGGGDVKLMAMLGAFLGFERGIEALLWTFVLGGIVGLSVLIWRVGLWRLLGGVVRQVFWTLRLGNWLPLSDEERRRLQPPLYLAPMSVVAIAIVSWDRFV